MRTVGAFLLVLLVAPIIVLAQYATINWEHPTTRVDGTPLSSSEISHYIFGCGLEDFNEVTMDVPAGSSSFDLYRHEFLPGFGHYGCAMQTVLHDGLRSVWSNSITIEYDPTDPEPPVLTITVH